MFRKYCLAGLIAFTALISGSEVASASDLLLVHVRVYRSPRDGKYEFIPNVKVELLRKGVVVRSGITSDDNGRRGTVNFKNLPRADDYDARALINKRWYPVHSRDPKFQGHNLQLDIVP